MLSLSANSANSSSVQKAVAEESPWAAGATAAAGVAVAAGATAAEGAAVASGALHRPKHMKMQRN